MRNQIEEYKVATGNLSQFKQNNTASAMCKFCEPEETIRTCLNKYNNDNSDSGMRGKRLFRQLEGKDEGALELKKEIARQLVEFFSFRLQELKKKPITDENKHREYKHDITTNCGQILEAA